MDHAICSSDGEIRF